MKGSYSSFLLTTICSVILACGVIFSPPQKALAQLADPALERAAEGVFEGMMSPYCPGRLLRDCPSSAAHELKEKIRGMITAGKSKEAILDEMAVLYGEHIRSTPPTTGFGLVGWITPAGFLVLGLCVVGWWLKNRQAEERAHGAVAPLSQEDSKRIQDELAK